MATDPTGARLRAVNAFFDSPRFPIKDLEPVKGDPPRDANLDDCATGAELPGWNAYVGAPGAGPG